MGKMRVKRGLFSREGEYMELSFSLIIVAKYIIKMLCMMLFGNE